MKYLFIVCFFFLNFKNGFAQTAKPFRINEITVVDTALNGGIDYVLNVEKSRKTENGYNLFKQGYGYFEVRVVNFLKGDTLRSYTITPSLYSFKKQSDNNLYPDYYSIVNGHLVLFFNDLFDNTATRLLEKKQKDDFIKVVDRFLEKPKKAKFYDANNKLVFTDKNYRLDYFLFHAGIRKYVLKNGSTIIEKDHGQL